MVSEVNAVPGARVEAAAPLFRIVDPAALELDLLVGRDVPVPTIGDRIEIVRVCKRYGHWRCAFG
ncbi:hypothetical protein GCM10023063_49990 [Arthrobacter methylotrophus]|uniref:hypothetical protein n=1 Tax=Arthrobacter methylotrophus TaxID=121291 RepID=UPI0033844533